MDIELTQKSTDLVVRAAGLRVVDQPSLSLAIELCNAGKGMIKTIKDFFAPLKQDAHASWKGLCDKETSELAKVAPTVTYLDREIVNYRVEQDRLRREAEEKARRQREERERIEREALREAEEKARKAQQEQARIDREAKAAALRGATRDVVEKIEAKRDELTAKAKADQDAIIEKAAAAESKLEPVVIVPEKVTTNGSALRHNWKFRVLDISLVPLEYMLVNEVMVGKIGRVSEGKAKIPGIEFYDEPLNAKTR